MLSSKATLQPLQIAIVIGVVFVGAIGFFSTQLFAQDIASTDLTALSDDDISAYRWEAMADYYAIQPTGSDLTTLSNDDVSAYRWEAMADYYVVQAPDSDLTTLSDENISAYRWEAMADFYAGQPDLAAVVAP